MLLVSICILSDRSACQIIFCFQMGDSDSPALEVRVAHLGHHDFRVDADGLSLDVSLAFYSKVR